MTTTVSETTVTTTEDRVLQRFIDRHRIICGRSIPQTAHLDGQGFYANVYVCSECSAGVLAEHKRYGKASTYTLTPSEAMVEAKRKVVAP